MLRSLPLLLCLLVGCGPSLPKTYPVRGKVVDRAGKPLTGGAITFVLASDSKVVADGEIAAGGRFTLTTKMHGKARAGAAEGEHHVLVETGPVAGPDGQPVIAPVVVPEKYKVAAKDNEFTIVVQKAGR